MIKGNEKYVIFRFCATAESSKYSFPHARVMISTIIINFQTMCDSLPIYL